MEEAEMGEEEEEEESPKELEPEEEEIAMAGRRMGFSALLGFGRKKEFAVEKSRFLRRSRLLPRRRRHLHCPPVPLGTGTGGLPLPQ